MNSDIGSRRSGSRGGRSAAMLLAEHFERGGSPGRAVGWYRRAAEQALGGNDFHAAIERAGRGIACGASGEQLGGLLLTQTEARCWLGDYGNAAESGS